MPTSYANLILTSHFADTCLVAELDGALVGFIGAYRPPTHPDSVFVWQIGVDAEQRGRGIGSALLHALVCCPGCEGVDYVEATVPSTDVASRKLFQSFARDVDAVCDVRPNVSARAIQSSRRESEDLYRVGPISVDKTMVVGRAHESI
jgi:L-2,4-diaminobutyric acid acetyltransferase